VFSSLIRRLVIQGWAGGLACIGCRAHVGVIWQARARCVLRATGAEQEGDEEEGH